MLVAIVIGLAIGSIYGLTAMGLVLTYRTSGIFNLAHGATGMLGTFFFWQFWQEWDVPMLWSLLIALLIVAPVIGVVSHGLVFRWVQHRPVVVPLVSSVALLVAYQGFAKTIWGSVFRGFPSLFPFHVVKISDEFSLTSEQIGTMVTTMAVALLLYAYLHRTKLGLRTRAVVDSSELAEISGVPSETTQTLAWIVGSMLATLSGILISPFIQLSTTGLTLVVIQATAAAVLGGLRSLPLTYLSGLALGVTESLLQKYLPDDRVLQGLRLATAFLVLYGAVNVFAGRFSVFHRLSLSEIRGTFLGREEDPRKLLPLGVVLGGIGVVLFLADSFVSLLLISGLVASIALQGLVLATGLGGQAVLCQASFVGIGAMVYARAVSQWGWPFAPSVLLALVVTVVLGLAVALPAVRVRGLPLALLTLGFGLFMDTFVFQLKAFSGEFAGFTVERPTVLGVSLASDAALGWFVLASAAVAALMVRNLQSGQTGRVLRAVKNSEAAAAAFGTSIRRSKIVLFTLSNLLGGCAGVLTAVVLQAVAPGQFNLNQSLMYVTVAVIGGVGSPLGAVVGGVALFIFPDLLDRVGLAEYQELVFGATAAAVLMAQRGGIADMIARPILRLARAWKAVSGAGPVVGTGSPRPVRPTAQITSRAGVGSRIGLDHTGDRENGGRAGLQSKEQVGRR